MPLLKAAILAGKWFNANEVRSLLNALGVVKGAVLKKDLVSALVDEVCPDLDMEARQKIIDSMSGNVPEREVDNPADLLKAVSCLDAKDQDLFDPLVKECVKELETRHNEEVKLSKEKAAAKLKKDLAATDQETAKSAKNKEPHDDDDDDLKSAQPLEKALKKSDPAQEPPLARERAPVSEERAARPLGRARKATPGCLRKLLPAEIDSLYLAWMPENRLVMVDFKGLVMVGTNMLLEPTSRRHAIRKLHVFARGNEEQMFILF